MIYPTVILKNTATGKYHPMPFRFAPRPSDEAKDETCRYRSIGHHTDGFATLKDAKTFISEQKKLKETNLIFSWDGTESPHTTHNFPPPKDL